MQSNDQRLNALKLKTIGGQLQQFSLTLELGTEGVSEETPCDLRGPAYNL